VAHRSVLFYNPEPVRAGFIFLVTESEIHRGGAGEQGGDGERRRGSRGRRRGSRKVEEALLRLLRRTARRGRLEVAGDERWPGWLHDGGELE
jgi:hypothetical protein